MKKQRSPKEWMMGNKNGLKHGMTGSPEHATWIAMRDRCRNPNNSYYHRYGGRGISVCNAWDDFEAFLSDVGRRPSKGYSIDRIDVNGNYEPGNVKWSTWVEQCRNRADTHYLTLNGVTKSLPVWADETGLGVHTIHSRLNKGWSTERTLTQPKGTRIRTRNRHLLKRFEMGLAA